MFPGHRYLGPGNSLNSGTPVDKDDEIAQQHDWAYEKATTSEDIRTADREAISQFTSDAIHNWNYHSAIGALGLSTKYAVESVTGVLYPSMSLPKDRAAWKSHDWSKVRAINKQRGATGQREASRDAQREQHRQPGDRQLQPHEPGADNQEVDETDAPMDEDVQADAPRVGGGGGGNTAGGSRGTGSEVSVIYKTPSTPKHTLTFENETMVLVWGTQWKYLNSIIVEHSQTATDDQFLITSLAHFPVDKIWFYMNNQQWNMLYPDATIKKVAVNLTPVGEQTSFVTGSTLSKTASVYHYVQGAVAVGLNKIYPTIPTEVDIDSGMNMSEKVLQEATWYDRIWGKDLGQNDPKFGDFPMIYGIPRDVPWYTTIGLANQGTTRNGSSQPGYSRLNKQIGRFTWTDKKGETFHYEYHPLNGTMKIVPTNTVNMVYPNNYAGNANQLQKFNITRGATETAQPNIQTHQTPATNRLPSLVGGKTANGGNILMDVEKSHVLCKAAGPIQTPKQQPSLHMGIYPVRSNDPSNTTDFVSCCGYIRMQTQIIIEHDPDSLYTQETVHPHMEQLYGPADYWAEVDGFEAYAQVPQVEGMKTLGKPIRYDPQPPTPGKSKRSRFVRQNSKGEDVEECEVPCMEDITELKTQLDALNKEKDNINKKLNSLHTVQDQLRQFHTKPQEEHPKKKAKTP